MCKSVMSTSKLSVEMSEGFYDAGSRHYLKSFAFKRPTHHSANRFIVIDQQDSVRTA
jgi:hypothetical protein